MKAKATIFSLVLALLFLAGIPVKSSAQATEQQPSQVKKGGVNFTGLDPTTADPEEYQKAKEAWIKANPEKYQAMNPGTPRPSDEGPTDLVMDNRKEFKAEEGKDPLSNYKLEDLPGDTRGVWVLSKLEGVPLQENVSQAKADQLALEASEDFPIGETMLDLKATSFNSEWGKGNYLKGDCGYVADGEEILLTRTRLCQSCEPILKFKVIEVNKSQMSLRLEDVDGSRIFYQLTFTKTN